MSEAQPMYEGYEYVQRRTESLTRAEHLKALWDYQNEDTSKEGFDPEEAEVLFQPPQFDDIIDFKPKYARMLHSTRLRTKLARGVLLEQQKFVVPRVVSSANVLDLMEHKAVPTYRFGVLTIIKPMRRHTIDERTYYYEIPSDRVIPDDHMVGLAAAHVMNNDRVVNDAIFSDSKVERLTANVAHAKRLVGEIQGVLSVVESIEKGFDTEV